MKGMQKIKRGSGFLGLLKYALSHEKAQEDGRLIGGTMNSFDVKGLSKEFGKVRKLRPDVDKPVWHNSLRLPAGEACSDMKWQEIADDYMTRMGFDIKKTQFALVKHDDENAIHIIGNRIMEDGTLYLGRNENLESTRHIQALEIEHKLTITKGLQYDENNRIVGGYTNAGRLSSAEAQKAKRTGMETPKERLKSIIAEALAQGPCRAPEFQKRLKDAGISVRANIAVTTQKFNGFSFEIEDKSNTKGNTVVFKGSQVGASWKDLQNAGISYDKNKDICITEKGVSLVDYEPASEPVLQPVSTASQREWDRQSAALDADAYLIHVDITDPQLEAFDPTDKTYTASQIRDRIPKLQKLDRKGYEISVEPVSAKWNYLLINGMQKQQRNRLSAAGFTPNFAMQISPDGVDAVVRIPKANHDAEAACTAEASKQLTQAYGTGNGDRKKIPLAGFKVRGFVSQIVETATAICDKAKGFFDQVKTLVVDAALAASTRAKKPQPEVDEDFIRPTPTTGAGAAMRARFAEQATAVDQKPKSQGDDFGM